MMTCREVLDFLMDYVDGNLSTAQRAIFEEHLAVCPPCVAYLHNYQQTVELVQSFREEKPSEEMPEDIIQKILASR